VWIEAKFVGIEPESLLVWSSILLRGLELTPNVLGILPVNAEAESASLRSRDTKLFPSQSPLVGDTSNVPELQSSSEQSHPYKELRFVDVIIVHRLPEDDIVPALAHCIVISRSAKHNIKLKPGCR